MTTSMVLTTCLKKIKPFFNWFWIQLSYYILISFIGYMILRNSQPKSSQKPRDFNLFFTSVSALTSSSMSTIEMGVFSNFQLLIISIVMLVGGDVFVSILKLQYEIAMSRKNNQKSTANINRLATAPLDAADCSSNPEGHSIDGQIELGLIYISPHTIIEIPKLIQPTTEYPKHLSAIKCLSYTVICYVLVVHVLGIFLISLYVNTVSSAKQILVNKGLRIDTFAVFSTASNFANCGYIPTNENMIVFLRHPGLLLILIPQILMGGTLYPSCLFLLLFLLQKITRRPEFGYIFDNYKDLGYTLLLSKRRSCFLAATVFGLLCIQLLLFLSMEWSSAAMDGLTSYEKLVSSLFQVSNTRHSGENVFDLSNISAALLVLFVIMMYLPPCTSFIPVVDGEEASKRQCRRKQRKKYVENLLLSQAFTLAIFVILICISERKSLKEDPLNFNVLNIVVEVVSAYGNVGYTMGYSCKRQINPDGQCEDKYYGFSGKWSDTGKLILIVVMFYGKFKNFHAAGGKAWKLY